MRARDAVGSVNKATCGSVVSPARALSYAAVLGLLLAPAAHGYNLVKEDNRNLDLNIEVVLGAFDSDKDYRSTLWGIGADRGSVSWQEGYAKLGLTGNNGAWYGGISGLWSAVGGDGDAAGFTLGDEDGVEIEDAFFGWKQGAWDVSLGRQGFTLGDGFLIANDSLNFGTGWTAAGAPEVNRDGAYWLAARRAFANTLIAKYQSAGAWRGDLFWLASGNEAQASTELVGVNVEAVDDKKGTVGAYFLTVTDVSATEFLGTYAYRDEMKVIGVRAQGSAGVENLFLSAEFAAEDYKGSTGRRDADAWYAEVAYTFAGTKWSPTIGYRYSSFSETFDPLFYGFTRGYGTWFQGEVAGNYTGPFNTNADIQQISLKLQPAENITVGLMHFNFKHHDLTTAGASNDDIGSETNIFVEWGVSENLFISPLYGRFSPGSGFGGSDRGDNDYFQVMAVYTY